MYCKNRIKISILRLVILVSCASYSCVAQQLSVDDFNFNGPMGSEGAQIEKLGKNHFKVILSHAPGNPNWSNMLQFEITKHAKGNTLRLDVIHEEDSITYSFIDYFSSWSYDGVNWQPIRWQKKVKNDSIVKGSMIFPEFTEDVVHFGHQVPMSYQNVEEMVSEWRKSPYVTVHTLGQSIGKRDIYRLEITDKQSKEAGAVRWSHYFINLHPGEHNSQWRMVGMIDWLLSDAGAACRKSSISHFILMISPDAPSKGWYRVNAQGVDMNRSYLATGSDPEKQAHEAYICQKDLEGLMASPFPVTDVWGMHTWGGVVEPILQPGPEMGTLTGSWETLKEIIIKNDDSGLVEPLKVRKQPGESEWTGGPFKQFGISVVLCEGGGGIYTKEANMRSGTVLMKSLAEFYR